MKPNTFIKTNTMAILAIVFAGSLMSFKAIEKSKAPVTYYYFHSGIAPGDFADPNNWTTADPGDCDSRGSKPCSITIDKTQDLGSVLGGQNNDAILGMSTGRRP